MLYKTAVEKVAVKSWYFHFDAVQSVYNKMCPFSCNVRAQS